jgi:hypothetical protein
VEAIRAREETEALKAQVRQLQRTLATAEKAAAAYGGGGGGGGAGGGAGRGVNDSGGSAAASAAFEQVEHLQVRRRRLNPKP